MAARDWGHDDDGSAPVAEFREHGGERWHLAHGLSVTATHVEFETDYAVAPGIRVRLCAGPRGGDPGLTEVGVEILRVDSRPDGRFLVSGRLQRHR